MEFKEFCEKAKLFEVTNKKNIDCFNKKVILNGKEIKWVKLIETYIQRQIGGLWNEREYGMSCFEIKYLNWWYYQAWEDETIEIINNNPKYKIWDYVVYEKEGEDTIYIKIHSIKKYRGGFWYNSSFYFDDENIKRTIVFHEEDLRLPKLEERNIYFR